MINFKFDNRINLRLSINFYFRFKVILQKNIQNYNNIDV